MPILCFEPIAGASGDMILGALFDLGADPEHVQEVIRSGGVHRFSLEFSQKETDTHMRYGFCDVRAEDEHSHRHLGDILKIIASSDASARVQQQATAIFRRLAEAEAAVHGIPLEKVHFHEVGAVDTVVDVLGACVALEDLGVDHVYCSEFKIGTGTVACSHGILPLPAPATAKLLEGFPVKRLDLGAELTTPTGAAILTTLSEGAWEGLTFRLMRTGAGHGQRSFKQVPNIIRAYLMETIDVLEPIEILESDIDDESPEVLAVLTDLLREQGALDATLSPLIMKKGRPGTRLQVIARTGDGTRLADLIFRQSSTLGIRSLRAQRYILPRAPATAETPWGTVAAKSIERPHGTEIVPEADACRELARKTGAPMRDIMNTARQVHKNYHTESNEHE